MPKNGLLGHAANPEQDEIWVGRVTQQPHNVIEIRHFSEKSYQVMIKDFIPLKEVHQWR